MARDGRALDRCPRGSLVRLASALRRYCVLRMAGASENIHRVAHVGPHGPHRSVRRDRDVRVVADETGVVVTGDREVGEPSRVGGDTRSRIQTLRGEARRREVARCGQRVAVDARLTAGRGPCPIDETDAHFSVEADRRPREDLVVPAALHKSGRGPADATVNGGRDRKSTRLNSSHVSISYAVFCLKKKNIYVSCNFMKRTKKSQRLAYL